jgi:hypothetical protein
MFSNIFSSIFSKKINFINKSLSIKFSHKSFCLKFFP